MRLKGAVIQRDIIVLILIILEVLYESEPHEEGGRTSEVLILIILEVLYEI